MIKIVNDLLHVYPFVVKTEIIEEGFDSVEDAQIFCQQFNVSTENILQDESSLQWLEGLPYPGSSEALQQMIDEGEEKYKQQQQALKSKSVEQLRADIDYILLMEDL